jgi:hypothetical protein
MKKHLITLVIAAGLCCGVAIQINAQIIEIEKTTKVWLRDGVPLKNAPTVKSRTLSIIPYGAIVKTLPVRGKPKMHLVNFSTADHRKPYKLQGKWVELKFAGKKGYVFDGYLSTMPVLKIDDLGVVETEDRYLKRNYGVASDTSRIFKGIVESTIYYNNGDRTTVSVSDFCPDHTIFFKDLNIDEVMLFKRVLFKDTDTRVLVKKRTKWGVEILYYVCNH